MGSDLYMESRNFRPRPTKVTWVDDDTIKIETDTFYSGYKTFYEGPVTERILGSMDVLGVPLPDKPARLRFPDEVEMIVLKGVVNSDYMHEGYDAYEVKFTLPNGKFYFAKVPAALLRRA